MKYAVFIAALLLIAGRVYAEPDSRAVSDKDHNHHVVRDARNAKRSGDQKVVRQETVASRAAPSSNRDTGHSDVARSPERASQANRYTSTVRVTRDRDRDRDRDTDSYFRVADHGGDRDRDRDWDRDSHNNHRVADRGHDRDWDDHYRPRSPAFYRPPVGRVEHRLPEHHIVVSVRRHPYYYYGGTFYDWYNGSYVIINAPLGARIGTLPTGYISFMVGPSRYFYYGGTYYIHDQNEYEVVQAPSNAQQIVNSAQEEMIIYPAKGQSDDQLSKDRYECHRWAVGQTGFDPSANDQDLSLKPDYNRAMGACLEARGYVVK